MDFFFGVGGGGGGVGVGRGKGYVGPLQSYWGPALPHPLSVHILNWYFCDLVFIVSHGN